MLKRAITEGRAPTFGRLVKRGVLVEDCVSSFPSVTPVASAEMVTGVAADRHWISGMNWYHRVERRYVEYGSSLEASRAFGIFRSLHDLIYNMNLAPPESGDRDRLRDPRRHGPPHRGDAVSDLPGAPPSPGDAPGPDRQGGRVRDWSASTTAPGGRRNSSTATSTRRCRCPASRARCPGAATSTRPAARPSWSPATASISCCSPSRTTTTTPTVTARRSR